MFAVLFVITKGGFIVVIEGGNRSKLVLNMHLFNALYE